MVMGERAGYIRRSSVCPATVFSKDSIKLSVAARAVGPFESGRMVAGGCCVDLFLHAAADCVGERAA